MEGFQFSSCDLFPSKVHLVACLKCNNDGHCGNYIFACVFSGLFTVVIIRTISVQAEKKKIANPTFLDPFDLRVHMPGHFPP